MLNPQLMSPDPDMPALGADDELVGLTSEAISPRKMAFRRYLRHKGAVVSTVVLAIMVLFVVLYRSAGQGRPTRRLR